MLSLWNYCIKELLFLFILKKDFYHTYFHCGKYVSQVCSDLNSAEDFYDPNFFISKFLRLKRGFLMHLSISNFVYETLRSFWGNN